MQSLVTKDHRQGHLCIAEASRCPLMGQGMRGHGLAIEGEMCLGEEGDSDASQTWMNLEGTALSDMNHSKGMCMLCASLFPSAY